MTAPPAGLFDSAPTRRTAVRITTVLLQISHRLAAVGLVATVGAVALIYVDHDPTPAVIGIIVSAALGLSAALLARSQSPRLGTIVVVSAVGLVTAGVLVIRSHPTSAVVAVVAVAAVVAFVMLTAEVTDRTAWREATAAVAVHAVLLTIALTLLFYGRRDPIRDDVQSTLAPTPALAQQ